MWKVLIADDEPKIRKGIKMSIDWQEMGLELCGMATNGKEAFSMIEEYKPDICLIDICMPFINGLSVIEKIHQINEQIICIVITGYDDFEYAQKAVSIGVFEYILKPVDEMKLKETLIRAKNVLSKEFSVNVRLRNAEITLEKNIDFLREQFFNDIILENVTKEEMQELAQIYHIDYEAKYIVLKVCYMEETGVTDSKIYNRKLFEFALRNIFSEILNKYGKSYLFEDDKGCLSALIYGNQESTSEEIKYEITESVAEFLKYKVIIRDATINSLGELRSLYEMWDGEAYETLSDYVISAKDYIDRNYAKIELSVGQIAEVVGVNANYLSRRFKAEVGSNIVEYITKIRIIRSMDYLKDTKKSIREIAEGVGYRTQHYYCVAFKKILGVTPTEFRKNF